MVDEPTFFRDVVAPLCVNLDFEVALRACLHNLSRYMPADDLIIFLMEPGLKSSRTIFVSADASRHSVNRIVPMPPETRKHLKSSPLPDLRIINRPELRIPTASSGRAASPPETVLRTTARTPPPLWTLSDRLFATVLLCRNRFAPPFL